LAVMFGPRATPEPNSPVPLVLLPGLLCDAGIWSGQVAALALLDTSATPDSTSRAARLRAGMESLETGRFVGVTSRLLPQIIHPSRLDGPIGQELRAMASRVGKDAFLRQQRAILGRPDSRPLLGAIRAPTQVAVGDGDQLTPPSESEDIHWSIMGSKLHVFEGCGHLSPPGEAGGDEPRPTALAVT
jgi:pimeloyl-ACP methyl ester carboxylesterase